MKKRCLGENLKKLRNQNGFSQEEVAKQLNISQSTLAKYENNQRKPNLDRLMDFAVFYHITTDYLLGLED